MFERDRATFSKMTITPERSYRYLLQIQNTNIRVQSKVQGEKNAELGHLVVL